MKTIYQILVCVILVALVSSCGKTAKVEPTPTNLSKSELLAGTASKAWGLSGSKIDGVDVYAAARTCSRDDIMVFRRDKVYEWNEGPTKCSSKDEQVYDKGSWEFNQDETEVVLNKTERYKIITLTQTSLQISTKNVFGETEELTFRSQSN